MDRRAFLNGLFGLAGVTALGGLTLRSAQATPLARALDQADVKPDAVAESGRTPDGTTVDKAHYTGWRHGHHPSWRRRRHSRVVCHNRWRYGRRVRVCRRVYY